MISKSHVGLYVTESYVACGEVSGFLTTPKLTRFSRVLFSEVEVAKKGEGEQEAQLGQQQATPETQLDMRAEAIKQVFENAGIRKREVDVALTAEEVMVRYFEMPLLPRKEWDAGIRFEAKKYIPFKMEEVVSDYLVFKVDRKQARMHIIFVAAKKDSVQELIGMLQELNIKVKSIEMVAFSLARSLQEQLSVDGATLLIEVESEYVTISIIKHATPFFTRDIPFAQKVPGLDYGSMFDFGSPDSEAREVPLAMEPMYESLFSEIRLSFDYYVKRFGVDDIRKIILIGIEGADEFEKWKNMLKHEFDIAVELAALSVKKEGNGKIDAEKEDYFASPGLLVVCGLGLRSFRGFGNLIDLYEFEGKTHKKIVDLFPRIAVAEVAVACILLIAVQMKGMQTVGTERSTLERLQAQQTSDMETFGMLSIQQLTAYQEKMTKRRNFLKTMLVDRDYLTKKINFLNQVLAKEIWINYLETGYHPVNGSFLRLKGAAFSKDKEKEIAAVNQLLTVIKEHKGFRQLFDRVELSEIKKGKIMEADITEVELVFWKR
ncbi:MAG: pilus assembly protein PilM [Candidatus Omnitrophica bacterium]|nr:pilus assembly protein PilM [Candidatus Omnitrophota bacterium]